MMKNKAFNYISREPGFFLHTLMETLRYFTDRSKMRRGEPTGRLTLLLGLSPIQFLCDYL